MERISATHRDHGRNHRRPEQYSPDKRGRRPQKPPQGFVGITAPEIEDRGAGTNIRLSGLTKRTRVRMTIFDEVLDARPGADVVVRAPGRANLIGEHTDYNLGYVLPVALELATYLAAKRSPGLVSLRSLSEHEEVTIDLEHPAAPIDGWGRYVAAVVRVLLDEDLPVEGLKGVIGSSVPTGAGLSSSSALEIAIASALSPGLDPVRKAELTGTPSTTTSESRSASWINLPRRPRPKAMPC